ncbi:MAG: CcmD family protein [Chloroflexi bacterium]|nr:CcmD family protein [Chloroflexota bacterium]
MNFLLFTLDQTPDTSGYMIAGFTVLFSLMLIYVVSLALRQRRLRQEIETLKELEKK